MGYHDYSSLIGILFSCKSLTSPRAPITHLQAWLKLGNPGRDPLKENSEIPTLLKDCEEV
ncbi:hypothetical protein, partial [Nostoc sp. NMS9]|uniref:hypothetical protein n=1 Tax=Nostoc sp. NMS9 TaxID=2815393 RepID=UPI0025EEBA3C